MRHNLPRHAPPWLVRGALRLAFGLACLVGLAGCAFPGLSTGPDPHILALQRLGAYQLRYPGATLLHADAATPRQGLEGETGAQVFETFGIHAPVPAKTTPVAILSWYGMQLQAQGWKPVTRGSFAQFDAQQVWVLGDRSARVGVYDPKQLSQYEPTVDPTVYPLVFQMQIIELNVNS